MPEQPIVVGAVAYTLHVVTIWEGFREYFREAGVPTDYVLFSNSESQVEALFNRQIDIAWNTNVAYARCEERTGGTCQVLGMRDVDVAYTTTFIAREDAGITALSNLRGKRFAYGSADSAQAALIPAYYLRQAGLDPERDVRALHFDLDVGKHGDTGTSELEVVRALRQDEADAGGISTATWLQLLDQGDVKPELIRPFWITPAYCHCNFTALPDLDGERARRWTEALLRMDARDPRWQPYMQLEGVGRWVPGRKAGYEVVWAALERPRAAVG
jgi:ABC-type phosphate/phosphonate transport system substrate-binding protein